MGVENDVLRVENNTHTDHARCSGDPLGKRWYYHDGFELHYFNDFSGEAVIGKHRGVIPTHSIFLLAPNLPHCYEGVPVDSGGEAELITDCMVLISEHNVMKIFQVFPELRKPEVLFEEAVYGIEFSGGSDIAEIGRQMAGLVNLEGCARVSSFLGILDKLIHCQRRTLNSNVCTANSDSFAPAPANLEQALASINCHFNVDISLDEAAEMASMSPSHFCRSFKKAYGTGFVDYMHKLRIERACELLRSSNKSISSIAEDCGYSNISSFNRNFRKYLNKPPSTYRLLR